MHVSEAVTIIVTPLRSILESGEAYKAETGCVSHIIFMPLHTIPIVRTGCMLQLTQLKGLCKKVPFNPGHSSHTTIKEGYSLHGLDSDVRTARRK